MQVKQIYSILNDVMKEVTGGYIAVLNDQGEEVRQEVIVNEDLSNIVDMGTIVFDPHKNWADNYVKSMINRIGREVFVDRVYSGYAPDVRRDAWEYGSIMSKTRCKIFDAKPNPSWSLEKGQTVNQFEFCPPEVTQKFYNHKEAWQIDCSFTNEQLKESFTSAEAMNRFIGMIENRINTSMTIYIDSLIMRTINNFMAEKIKDRNGVVDVLTPFNALRTTPLSAEQAANDKDWFRYFALQVKKYVERFRAPSVKFNTEDSNVTFTPRDFARLVIHSDISSAMEVYLQSDTYHDDLVKIGQYETVPFWQTQGENYDLAETSRIDVKVSSDGTIIDRNYIVGVLFDYDALGVLNDNRRTTSSFNANGEYWTNFYKIDTSYFNDLAENGIIFIMGSGQPNVITIPMEQDETIWGYKVSELQGSDLTVDNNFMKISGTLEYIVDGALPPTWGDGNFMALKWLSIPADATSCKIGIDNLVEIIDDPERSGTVKVSDTTKKLRVVTTTPAGVQTQLYDLSGLTLRTPSARISPRPTTMTVNETVQLTAETYPEGLEIVWSSKDEEYATVSETGLVTATGAGTADIRVSTSGSTQLDHINIAVSAEQAKKTTKKTE